MSEVFQSQERQKSELVTFRAPTEDVDALRLICQATGISMSEEIRTGIKARLDILIADPEVQEATADRISKLQSFYGDLQFPVSSPEDQ